MTDGKIHVFVLLIVI